MGTEVTDRQVRSTVYVDEARTLVIPAGLEGVERAAWRERAVAFARAAASHWEDSTDQLIPDIIDYTLDQRGADDMLVLQLWPNDIPVAALVHVSVHESPGIDEIGALLRAATTSRVEKLIRAQLGAGREWLHGATLPGAETETLIGLQSCFADDDLMIVVTLDATMPDIFSRVVDEVRTIVASMEIYVGGDPWHAMDVGADVGTRRDLELWPEVDGAG